VVLICISVALSQTLAYNARHMGLMHRVVCLLTPQLLHWSEFILLGDKGTQMQTTWLRLLLAAWLPRVKQPSSRKSNILITKLPSHPHYRYSCLIYWFTLWHVINVSSCWQKLRRFWQVLVSGSNCLWPKYVPYIQFYKKTLLLIKNHLEWHTSVLSASERLLSKNLPA